MSQTTLYASVLAKIGAERSKLLSEVKLKTLTESRDLSAFVAQLRETSYQAQIAKVPLPLTSRKLERAFNENLIESYAKIVKNSPKNATKYLNLHPLRFEVENIKALIKAAYANLSPEQKLAKIYLSIEDYLKKRSVIEEAAKAPALKQMVNALKSTEYAFTLNTGLQNYEESGSTARFDMLLDKTFYEKLHDSYESLPKKEKPHAHFYASTENDSFTLLTLLRGKTLNYDANWLRLAVPHNNFNLSMETVEALLSAADFESALKIALESHYAKFFVKAQNPEETVANAEKAFKRAVFQHAKASRIGEIFNIGAPLAFMTQKEAEVHDLIATSSGVEAAVNPEEIQGQLLL
ncbi:MAG: V-type ATPase subunit [Candidatus Bathyarchaeia archaeon]